MLYETVVRLAGEKGISISKLEEMADLGNGAIGKWRVFKPTLRSLEKVARVLEVPVSALLEGK